MNLSNPEITDLSTPEVNRSLFLFLYERRQSLGLSKGDLERKLSKSGRNVNTYFSNEGKDFPKTITADMYKRLLEAVDSNDEDFKIFHENRIVTMKNDKEEKEKPTTNAQDNRGVDHITISNNTITGSNPFANKGNITIINLDK